MGFFFEDEEINAVKKIGAGQAATPMYLGMQGEGAGAIGDILGLDTPGIDAFAQEQEQKLSGFESKYPERLLESESPVSWWAEKAALNSMNTIVPMMGFAIGSTLKLVPHPVAKILGSAVYMGTYALTYNANLADTLQEHEERAGGRQLSQAEKMKAAVVAAGVTYLDMLVPKAGASAMSKAIGQTFGRGGLQSTKKVLQKMVNTNRQSLAAQAKTGGKYLGGLVGKEMATEAGQKALQIGTSVEPQRLASSEGMQDILEESIVAGPVVGAIGAPSAVGVGRAQNRDIGTARRLAKDFNAGLAERESETSKASIKSKEIKIPEYQSTFDKLVKQGGDLFESKTGTPLGETSIVKGLKLGYKGIAEKPLSDIDRIAKNAKTGFTFHAANKLRQMFMPTESGSNQLNENTGNNDFYNIRDTKSGFYLEPITEILAKYTNRKAGFGELLKSSDPNVIKYLREGIKGNNPSSQLLAGTKFNTPEKIKEINADIAVISEVLNKRIFKDLRQSGISINEQLNYLTNPLNAEQVAENRDAFIRLVKESDARAVAKAKEEGRVLEALTPEKIERMVDKIVGKTPENVNPIFRTQGKDKKKKPQKQPSFEKTRSERLQFLDELALKEGLNFRETSLEKILTGYAQEAATRVASVRAFGQNAVMLNKRLKDLADAKAIDQEQIERVYDVYDAVHNNYKKDANPDLLAVSRIATRVGAMTHLGLATLSSLTELAWIGERAGFGNMLRTIPEAFRYSREGGKKLKTGEYVARGDNQRTMAILGFNLDPRVNERLDALFATDKDQVLNAWFRSPLGGMLTQWTNFNRNWAAQAMLSNLNTKANGIINGDLSDIEQQRLASELKENGISMENWQSLMDVFTDPETGKVNINLLDDKKMDIILSKEQLMIKPAGKRKPAKFLSEEDAREFTVRDLLVPWMHKVVDDVVVHPKATNKPMWMSDPRLAVLAQLKTFPVVFGNTVVKRLLKKLNPKQCTPDFGAAVGAAGGIAMAYAIVYVAEMLKDGIRQQDFEEPGFRETIDRAGLTGWVGLVGGAGRFQDDATTALGGTAVGFVNRVFDEFITPVYTGETVSDKLDSIPNLFDWLGESIDGSLGPLGAAFKPLGDLIDED